MVTMNIKEFISKLNYEQSLEFEEELELHIEDLQANMREPIPDFGENIPFQDFILAMRCHAFCSSDGHGYYATETEMSKLPFRFYDVRDEEKCEKYGFSHIMWFNK